ncbi:MAG: hypothetical protein P8Y75_13245 [Nitrospirota bacterium]|jgi:hypothetical protein
MGKSLGRVLAVVLLAGMLSGCTTALTSARIDMRTKNPSVKDASVTNASVRVAFTRRDVKLIRAYYRKNLPPGLAKKKRLPPGLQRQVQRNGTLPPGLAARSLPRELERKLSPIPENYVRLRVGMDIVLMDTRTRVVLDIVKDIS